MMSEFNNAKHLTTLVFKEIDAAASKSDLNKRVHGLNFKTRNNDQSYPSIPFTISPEEIKIIASDGHVSKLIGLGKGEGKSGLEKLLLAMAWKQNDLKKLGGIIRGIQSVADDPEGHQFPEKSMVFYFFGRHLAIPTRNPIIDQHVIRAFAVLHSEGNEELKWQKRGTLTGTKNDQEIVKLYLEWHSKLITAKKIGNSDKDRNFLEEIDFVLMQLGRRIKS
jgi:hypothetical protein